MKCPKCGKNLPDDSIFCTSCGCNLEEAENDFFQIEPEERAGSQQMNVKNGGANSEVPEKKSKAVIILLVLLIISLLGCAGLLVIVLNLQSENIVAKSIISEYADEAAEYENEISALEEDVNEARKTIDALEKEKKAILEEVSDSEEIIDIIASNDTWGYATENFHADRGIVVLKANSTEKVNIYMGYYTDAYMKTGDKDIADAFWSTQKWTEKGTFIEIVAGKPGITTLEFTNDLYDTKFEILVIVTE